VIAAGIVLDLQTLVSRETNPTDPAVVTVGSIHGGTKHNVIPDEVKLQLTVRSTKDSVRKHLLEGIKRVSEAAPQAAGAPAPVVHVDENEFTPALYNEPGLTRKTVEVIREALGGDKVRERPPVLGARTSRVTARAACRSACSGWAPCPPSASRRRRRRAASLWRRCTRTITTRSPSRASRRGCWQ
jgi:hippurate hydrolase